MEFKNDKYRVKSDEYQWGFYQFSGVDKQGKEVWKPWGYWPSIELLFDRVVERVFRTHESVSDAEIDIANKIKDLALRVSRQQDNVRKQLNNA